MPEAMETVRRLGEDFVFYIFPNTETREFSTSNGSKPNISQIKKIVLAW
jgi:hypothetical protein